VEEKKRAMFLKLLMLFTIVPIVELYLLVGLGEKIGTLNTIAVVIVTGILGASFARSQGSLIVSEIRNASAIGQIPGRELVQGAMVLAGGIMLITPGLITDLIGLSLIFPLTRQFYTNLVLAYFKKKFESGQVHFTTITPDQEYLHQGDDKD